LERSARRREYAEVSYTVKTRFRRRWARRSERWAEEREEQERFWQTPEGKAQLARKEGEHKARVETIEAELLAQKEAKRRKRADASKKRIDAMTDDQRIAALRKQLENPRTPRQFIPSIQAKLRMLELKLQTVAGMSRVKCSHDERMKSGRSIKDCVSSPCCPSSP
jgi:hypothetical protein